MRILALDISTTHIGWCIGDGADYVRSGVLAPSGDLWQRLTRIADMTHNWFYDGDTADDERPTVVAFEEPRGNHANMHTNIVLGYAVGLWLSPWLAHGWEIVPVHVQQIKATGCHKGTRRNPGPRRVAASIAGKDEIGPDEADAIGCWLAALSKLREREWETS